MKKCLLLIFTLLIGINLSHSQTQPVEFGGAVATLKTYNALYILNSNDEKKIKGILRNMENALEDTRLKGKLHLELVAFGDGVAVYMKNGIFEPELLALKAKGVLLAQCYNTVRELKIDRNDLFPFITYVPSGNGEIILRQYEGWATVHP